MYNHIFKDSMLVSEDTFIRLYKDLIVLTDGKANFYIMQVTIL
jgi:hypothetical protein